MMNWILQKNAFIRKQMRGLSIAGAYPFLIATGRKRIELRNWEEKEYRGIVLLHCSSSKAYDFSYKEWNVTLNQCPKSAIIGAAKLVGCVRYDSAIKWKRDRYKYLWNISYQELLEHYDYKPPYGHVFENAVFFEKPILNVSGTFRYWIPKTDEQKENFKIAADFIYKLHIPSLKDVL